MSSPSPRLIQSSSSSSLPTSIPPASPSTSSLSLLNLSPPTTPTTRKYPYPPTYPYPSAIASSSRSTLLSPSAEELNKNNTTMQQFVLPPVPIFEPPNQFPELPPVEDKELEEQAFTHTSFYGQKKSNTHLELTTVFRDNEKLEHVGDSIINSVVVLLCHRLFPHLDVGGATLLKSHLVSNRMFAQLSSFYGLPKRLRCDPSAAYVLRHGEKSQANIFEAYVAALYLSYIKSSLSTSSTGRLPSPPRTPSKSEDIQNDDNNFFSPGTLARNNPLEEGEIPEDNGIAFVRISIWLNKLFTPIARWVMEELRAEQMRLLERSRAGNPDDSDLDELAVGATAILNEHSIRFWGKKPEYACEVARVGMWNAMCTVISPERGPLFGEAARSSKKAAQTIAAYKILAQLNMV